MGDDCIFCSIQTLCRKEVINVCDGMRLGYVSDVEFNTETAAISALLVEDCSQLPFGKKGGIIRAEWQNVCIIGDETVLVRFDTPPQPEPKKRKSIGEFLKK